jgi:hypothetical protein
MKAVVIYECGECQKRYETLVECESCELGHLNTKVITHKYIAPRKRPNNNEWDDNSLSVGELIHQRGNRVYILTASGLSSKVKEDFFMEYIHEDPSDNLSTMLLGSDKESRDLAKRIIRDKIKKLKDESEQNSNGKKS